MANAKKQNIKNIENTQEDCCKTDIDEIKKSYEILRKKYSLPEFKELNEEFDIGKAEFNSETLLRDIRKVMVAKFFSILSFTELLLNPSSGSMFYIFLVKGINSKEKEILGILFDKLGVIEIDSFNLDVEYSEQKEAEFIKEKSKEWQGIKKDLGEIISKLKKEWGTRSVKKEKSYFG